MRVKINCSKIEIGTAGVALIVYLIILYNTYQNSKVDHASLEYSTELFLLTGCHDLLLVKKIEFIYERCKACKV